MDIDAALHAALRVLVAICGRTKPNAKDVTELQRIAPTYANLAVDELACKVVDAALEQRKKERAMHTAG